MPSGGTTQIEIVVTNPSASAATNVVATLATGAGLTKGSVSCTARNGAACPTNPADLVIPSLPAGGSLQFLVDAVVASGATGAIASTVSVTAVGDAVITNNSAQVVLNVYAADVRVTSSTAGGDYFSGALATYSMTLSNAGPDLARNVGVQNVVGAGQALSSISCTAAGGAVCPASPAANMTIPELPSGASLTFTVQASIALDTFGAISNTLYASVEGDPLKSNNVATSSAIARLPTSPQSSSFVSLRSDSSDFIGAGRAYDYSLANATIGITANGNLLSIDVHGNETWHGDFALPAAQAQLFPGTYSGLTRYPFNDAAIGGLSWYGEGRGCNTLTGTFTIDSVTYAAGTLATVDLRFEQHCEGGAPALRGQIHWIANDATRPSGPVNPPPAGLWSPAPGATPATGNYIYLQSDGGDYIGAGSTYTYTQANALLTITGSGNTLSFSVAGDEGWFGDFAAMSGLVVLQPGYYANLQRYPFYNPASGGFDWSGEGRGCNTLAAWVVIDSITFSGTALASLDLRFEQHCEGLIPALRGKIHWIVGDPTQPHGPQVPPPANLWTPAAGVTPASGNYVYLESQASDYIGQGQTYTYTQADSELQATVAGARLDVSVVGNESWTGNFQAMNTLAQLQLGYYGNLQRYPFQNPVVGGVSWYGDGRGCNTLTGWFVVDNIDLSGGSLNSIDLRFEQHCEGLGPALHGKIHWAAGDTTAPPGPQNPAPAGLWTAPAGATPASGNYVYLASDVNDFVGQGRTYTYTGANAILSVTSGTRLLTVGVTGDETWGGSFYGMNSLQQLVPGYYGNLQRYPFNNPVRGGLSWSGEGRGCNTLTGWFVVDAIAFAGGSVSSVDLRFEQHCDGGPALHGQVHWDANDPTRPPGPISPPPSNLWAPASGATPATGNYVYLSSDTGDYIGQGRTYVATPATGTVTLTANGGHLAISVAGADWWTGDFQTMSSISSLQPGYYGSLERYPFHNPAKGGLSWYGDSRGCNTLTGWFVIDSVTFSAGNLASIDLRFEQHCEGLTPAIRGAIHWIQ